MFPYLTRLFVLACIVGASGCASSISGAIHESLEQPVANLSARDTLRITVISSVDVKIRLQASYATRNSDCEVQKWPGNPKIGHVKHEVFEVPTSRSGATVDVLVDKYQPGRCQWEFGGMSVSAIGPGDESQGGSGLLALSHKAPVPIEPLRIRCGKIFPSSPISCYSSIHYIRSDVRAVTFETVPYERRPR